MLSVAREFDINGLHQQYVVIDVIDICMLPRWHYLLSFLVQGFHISLCLRKGVDFQRNG